MKTMNDVRSQFVQVRMNEGEKAKAERLAARYDVPLSLYIRQLLRREYELTFERDKLPARAGAGPLGDR